MKVRNTTQLRVRVEGVGFIEPGEERELPVDVGRVLVSKFGFEEVKKKIEKKPIREEKPAKEVK